MAQPGGENLFQLLPDANDGDLNELLTKVTEEADVKMEVQRRQRWEEKERALQEQLKMENLFQLLPDDSDGDLNELLTKVTEEAKAKMEVQRRQRPEEKEQEQLKPEVRQQERARNNGRRTGQENPMAAKKLELPRQLLKSLIVFRKEKPVQEPGKNQDQNGTAAVSQGLHGFPPSKDFQGNQTGRRNSRWNHNNEAADQENQGGYRPRRYRHYNNEGGKGDQEYPKEGSNYQAYGPRRYRNHNNQGENAEEGNYYLRNYHRHGGNYQGYPPRRYRYYNNREGNGYQESIVEVSHEGSYQRNGGNQGYRPRRYRYYNNEGDNYQVEDQHDHGDAGDQENYRTNNGYEGNYRRRRNYKKKDEEQTGADQNSHRGERAEVPENSEKEEVLAAAAAAAYADEQEVNGENKGPGERNVPDPKNVEKMTNINGSKRKKMKRDRKKGIVDTDKKKPEEAKEEENARTMSYKEYQKIQEQKKAASEAQPQPETAEKKDDSKEDNLKKKDSLDKQRPPRTMKITEFHMLTSAAGDRSHTDRQRPKWTQNEGEAPDGGNGRPRYEDQRSFEGRRSGPRGGRNGGRGFPRKQFAPSDGQSSGDHGERPSEGRRYGPREGRNGGRGFPRQKFAPSDGQSPGDSGERPFEGQSYGGGRSGGGGGGHDGGRRGRGFPRKEPEPPGIDASKEEYVRQFPALERGTKNPPHLPPAGAAIDAAAVASDSN